MKFKNQTDTKFTYNTLMIKEMRKELKEKKY